MVFRVLLLALFCNFYAFGLMAESCDLSKAVSTAEELTGLRKFRDVKCIILSRNEFEKSLSSSMLQYKRKDQIVLEEIIHKIFGIIPFDFPYKKCAYRSLSDEVPAYYDEISKIIKFGISNPPFHTLVHESVHALQDQHFNLHQYAKRNFGTLDNQLASLAIVEGQAEAAENLVIDENQMPPEGPKDISCTLPEKLDREFAFPYDFGTLLVKKINDSKAIQKILINPPRTSAWIMNQKFNPSETIDTQSLPAKLCHNSTTCYPVTQVESLGQYFFSLVFARPEKNVNGIPAAVGWSDDVLLWASNPSGTLALIENRIILKSEKDIDEFWNALIESLELLYEVPLQKNHPE